MGSAQPARRAWTYRDLVALPEDQLRHELIDGEHFVTPSPNTGHQEISKHLFRALDAYVERHRTGEVLYAPFDVKLSLFTVLVPDLVYFTAGRFAQVVNEKHATAAPDLVVEILSPGTRRRDKGRKRAVSSTPCTRAPAEAIGTARHYNARQERRCLWWRAPGWAPMKSSG